MVKGVARQVIVVQSPDRKLFEQAIFILREDADRHSLTEEMLLQEAKKAARSKSRHRYDVGGPVWACGGALLTGALWLLTVLF